MTAYAAPIRPGFITLHGNRLEDLAETVIEWLQRQPLAPLEEEVVLVQSNSMAEWFKMEMASHVGVCTSTRVELPNRFLWRTYRHVLAPDPVPRDSPLDKVPMTWRLMKVLPTLLEQEAFAPVKGYLREDANERMFPLASQLADLFDQYQNYRSDWLEDWASGHDILRQASDKLMPVPDEQRWQPLLWRAVMQGVDESQVGIIRPRLHRLAVDRLTGETDYTGKVARRVVVFGMSHLPASTLEAIAALGRHSQVVLAVPNPCRFFWGDIVEGRELLTAQRRRQHLKDQDLSVVNMEDMHLHAHPLLAAWGRQSRDYIRMLDAHDDVVATQQQFNELRIDLFETDSDKDDTPLLRRIQNRIRDLEPVPKGQAHDVLPEQDQSIMFHVAHGPVREMEILHDQLLQLLQTRDEQRRPLAPRDIVVMVPDIDTMIPAIRAVFDQYPKQDPRHIPYGIADLSAKASSPIVGALEWLIRLPAQRCRLSELVDLLEVPALARRLNLSAEKLPHLKRWMGGAGIRWGLDRSHREGLGLGSCGDVNSAWFGLQRVLLGYASGSIADLPQATGWETIEPYEEIGGLEAELAGVLAQLIQSLMDWQQQAKEAATPAAWIARGHQLLETWFTPYDESERDAIAALKDALDHWEKARQQAAFEDLVDWSVFEQAWMEALKLPNLEKRFRAGGVTFCSLMPMRAIPFEVVCLLGMNEGDYPRRTIRNDFDLMGLAGHYRPGDRSRQLDDRQLMLDALLSARSLLYVSWSGFSAQDNSERPPSVVVSQLRDYIEAMWGKEAVVSRTTEHPLQPFSRSYFSQGSGLQTFVHEWRDAHQSGVNGDVAPTAPSLPHFVPDSSAPLTVQRLVTFLRNPVKVFFRERLGVVFDDAEQEAPDEEVFTVDPLQHYKFISDQVRDWPDAKDAKPLLQAVPAALDRLRRTGALPLEGFGELERKHLELILVSMAKAWVAAGEQFPTPVARKQIDFTHSMSLGGSEVEVLMRDWIEHLFQPAASENAHVEGTWMRLEPSRLLVEDEPRPDKLIDAWVRSMAAAACGHKLDGVVVGQDATLRIRAMAPEQAHNGLETLLGLWFEGMQSPLPLPMKTALATAGDLQGVDSPQVTYEGSTFDSSRAEFNELCLARLYPSFESLCADGRLQALSDRIYRPMLAWIQDHVTCKLHQ